MKWDLGGGGAYVQDLGGWTRPGGVRAGAELRVSTARGGPRLPLALEGGGSGPEFQ